MRRLLHSVRRQDGAVMTEFALVSIVAFLLMFTMAEMGLIIFGNSAGSNGAREGARYGIIHYVNADNTASTTYSEIRTRVINKLVGNVRNPLVTVTCRPAADMTASVACTEAAVDLLAGDVLEVRVQWQHKGATPFVPVTTHTATARMVIQGEPDLSASPTTSSTSTTTTSSSTTTTTSAAAKKTKTDMFMADDVAGVQDGVVETVQVTFNGTIGSDPACDDLSKWHLSSPPSGGSLTSVAISGSTATLSMSGTTKNTAVGSFTVSFDGCNDANGFSLPADIVPSDGAAPVFVSISDNDSSGSGDGKLETGNTLTVTFSEALSPTWGASTSSAVLLLSNGTTETLSFPSLSSAAFNVAGYMNGAGNATFTSTLSVSGSAMTLTLGPCTSTGSGCGSALKKGSGAFTFTPDSSIRETTAAGGKQALGPVTGNFGLF